MLKKVIIHARKSIKFTILLAISVFLIIGIVTYFFKPTYKVIIGDELVGYTSNKTQLQAKINDYIQNGDGQSVAFVELDKLPEYQLCLLKRGIVTNDDEIYEKIKTTGTSYYRYYSVSQNGEEKAYVESFADAENVVNNLKEKQSSNIEQIAISEKYETNLQNFTSVDDAVKLLYTEPVKTATNTVTNKVDTSYKVSSTKVNLGISLIRPISGIITSRFGASSRIRASNHTGLDISASTGTPIKAAASGTVTFSGRKGSYGYMVVLSHGNGVQTYYGHCSKLYVSAGQTVSQGDVIAAVGSTGNSTGPHLHLEIRVNGVAYNPQNYLY